MAGFPDLLGARASERKLTHRPKPWKEYLLEYLMIFLTTALNNALKIATELLILIDNKYQIEKQE